MKKISKYQKQIRRSVREYALNCMLQRAVKQSPTFSRGGPGIIALVAADGVDTDSYSNSVMDVLYQTHFYNQQEMAVVVIEQGEKPKRIVEAFAFKCGSAARAIVLTPSTDALPPTVMLAVDKVIHIGSVDGRALQAACAVVLNMKISLQDAEALCRFPMDQVYAVLRRGRKVSDILERLSKIPVQDEEPTKKQPKETPALEAMHGYGEAKAWGMELARDLADWKTGVISWDDVDRGVLLSGPPGVGKTVFAQALANQCDVPLIASSLGQWQSTGHLGDLLKAMRGDFRRAREQAPCIMFVDEIDSLGDRKQFRHDHSDYSIQVVNAFLECLDGVGGREGIVVVGATNDPDRIDPAILRAGRLDRHIRISLPTADERLAILAHYIGQQKEPMNLKPLASVTSGMTGADLAKAVRDARRLARRERRDLQMSDLKSSLPKVIPIVGEQRRAIAIHEAGHTVVGLRLKVGTYLGTKIEDHLVATNGAQQAGAAYFEVPSTGRRDRQFYLDQLAVVMAGLAAEELVLGNRGDGAGLGDSSDLALATRIATSMEGVLGMGDSFTRSAASEDAELERLRRANPDLNRRVEETLHQQFQRAKGIVKEELVFLNDLVNVLVERGFVPPAMADAMKAEERPNAQGERAAR
ncbi:AAA family ATPase [Rhizobium sp. AG855]|uniref:AAA family ATPase n=1 Tax=Rhizobium sp. AG855 TaxID=2183898 RepID=UPI000E7400F0|nr:AAA family ATPase [Rhizobium sp. AG855]RKE86272.1 ATP-dependent Zn protease [Rhizobium sp. AG855]